MYLKNITLRGFKSFADKTTLEFDPIGGITAVVGPNGCGKSNLVDALRWVIGEQNPKELRSIVQEEIVFAGSAARKPLSLAEVTLILDNSDGLLSLDYNEISVRRRYFRSGESEFFINKTPCRLKDIRDLFFDTGLGDNSYSIISQGQVDAILSSKPEERRAIFEEAAGINKYKFRKGAAERKLIATEQNLLRINDLKVEITSQLSTLEEQAKKAKEYKELKDKLRELEIGVFKRQMQGFSEKQGNLEQKINALKEKLEGETSQVQKDEQERKETREHLRDLENKTEEARTKIQELRNSYEDARSSLTVERERQKYLEERQELVQIEIEEINAQLKSQRQQVEEKKKEISQKIADVKQEIEEINEQVSSVRQKIASLSSEKKKLVSTAEEISRNAAKTKEEIDTSSSRLDLLLEMQRDFEGYFQGVKETLRAKKSIPGIHGTIADLIKVPSALEGPLETALGSSIQNIVTDNDGAAKKAIDYLRGEGRGRATFLPLNLINATPSTPLSQELKEKAGVKGRAPELIKFDQKYAGVVEYLLGNTFVVDTLDNALKLVKEIKEKGIYNVRLVTLTSDLITTAGPISGGSPGQHRSSLLGREREIIELKEDLKTKQKDFSSLDNEITNIKTQIATKEKELEEQIKEEQKLNISQATTTQAKARLIEEEKEVGGLSSAANQTEARLKGKEKEKEEVVQRLSSAGQDILRLEESMPTFAVEEETLKNNIKEFIAERENLSQRLETLEEKFKKDLDADRALRDELTKQEVILARLEAEIQGNIQRLTEEYSLGMEEIENYPSEIKNITNAKKDAEETRRALLKLEPVNLLAIEEFEKAKERITFINNQCEDLAQARTNLATLINELDNKARNTFLESIKVINTHFGEIFSILFEGGEARLRLEEGKDPLEAGVEIYARPHGKKMTNLSLLSGGERALTATALLFAFLKTHPSPFCFLDEVDAALDEINIRRFIKLLKEFSKTTQMVLITHSKQTMAMADVLYGVTMEEPGISQLVSLKFTPATSPQAETGEEQITAAA